jgi:hypothetical protein
LTGSKKRPRDTAGRKRSQRKTGGPKTEATHGGAAFCPSCGTAAQAQARFCHACGAALGDAAAPSPWNPKALALVAVVALGAGAVAGVAGFLISREQAAERPPQATASPDARSASAVDLSSMTPREAADRLFNRVMVADEQGNVEEAQRFASKALQAYDRVAGLDADAHYHIGHIHLVAGDVESTREQIAVLQRVSPDHLLAYVLEHSLAELSGDLSAAAAAAESFAAAYDKEIATGRAEYEAHSQTIERFRANAP